jgi:hypothetical protein
MVVGLSTFWPQEHNSVPLTRDENEAHFSLWAIMKSPMVLGLDLRHIPPDVLSILKNKEVLSVNQDSLAVQATRISSVAAAHRDETTKAQLLPCEQSDTRQHWRIDAAAGTITQDGPGGEQMCLELFECEMKWPFTMSVSRCGADKTQPKCEGITGSQQWSAALTVGSSGQIVSRMRADPESRAKVACEGDASMNTSHCCMDNSGVNPRVVSCDFSTGMVGDVPLKVRKTAFF